MKLPNISVPSTKAIGITFGALAVATIASGLIDVKKVRDENTAYEAEVEAVTDVAENAAMPISNWAAPTAE